jgi:hypothetical protein
MDIAPRPANKIDDKILQLADNHSPEEISRALGGVISPAKVAAHTQTLLKSKNWLTAAQEDALISYKMKRILLTLEGRFMDNDNFSARLKLLKEIGGRLDKRETAKDADLNKLYNNQGRIMGQVVDLALTFMKGALRKEIDADQWDALVQEALRNAQAEIAKHEAIDE